MLTTVDCLTQMLGLNLLWYVGWLVLVSSSSEESALEPADDGSISIDRRAAE